MRRNSKIEGAWGDPVGLERQEYAIRSKRAGALASPQDSIQNNNEHENHGEVAAFALVLIWNLTSPRKAHISITSDRLTTKPSATAGSVAVNEFCTWSGDAKEAVS